MAKHKKQPTEKQIKARTRNWRVKQLRAYYHLIPPGVSKEGRKKLQAIIDEELEKLEAEPETKRRARLWEEFINSPSEAPF